LADDQGNVQAAALGTMYASGRGVPQDFQQAFVWFQIVAPRLQGQGQERAKQMLDAAAMRLTPSQRAEAERLAQAWKPGAR
jgi:uncharacterized protein